MSPPPRSRAAHATQLVRAPKLTVTLSRTADGAADYMQILSLDQFSLNIVLIADVIVIDDARKSKRGAPA